MSASLPDPNSSEALFDEIESYFEALAAKIERALEGMTGDDLQAEARERLRRALRLARNGAALAARRSGSGEGPSAA
jgi:predicted phage gp36 major capsid-like protein